MRVHITMNSVRRFCAATLMLLFFAALPVHAQTPQPGRGTNLQRERKPVVAPVFRFQSGFWLNLHHFLYQQARLRSARPVVTTGNPDGPTGELAEVGVAVSTDALTPEELKAWNAALGYYSGTLARRDLLFDNFMVLTKNRLSELPVAPDLSISGLRREMVAALETAAPVYRAHWWAAHDRVNQEWIAHVAPMVAKLGTKLAQDLAYVYQADWPEGPVAVDVANYAGRVGGYTSLDPVHVTISSADPRNQGEAALEILFHEASHGLARLVSDAIAREYRRRNKPIPRELWHAVLFYTTGEVVRRALSADRPGQYMPYAYRHGLYARGWQNFQWLLERHWQPYLDGKIEFDRAIARMANSP